MRKGCPREGMEENCHARSPGRALLARIENSNSARTSHTCKTSRSLPHTKFIQSFFISLSCD